MKKDTAKIHESTAFPDSETVGTDVLSHGELVSTLIDAIGALVILIDSEGRIVAFNRACELATGQVLQEARGRKAWDVFAKAEEAEQAAALFEKVKDGEVSGHIETSWMSRNGERRLIRWSHMRIIDRQGSFDGVLATGIDITEHRNAEAALQQSLKEAQDIRFALDQSAIVTITDQKGLIHYANDRFCETSGYSREELLGRDHRILNSGYHSKEYIRNLWETIGRGEVWKGEFRNRAKDGSLYWIDTTIVPFLDSDGKPYQYVSIRNDITERKRSEFRLSVEHAIARILAETARQSDASRKILRALCEKLDCEFAEMFMVDVDFNILRCQDVWAVPSEEPPGFDMAIPICLFAPGEGHPGRVWNEGTPLWTSAIPHDQLWNRLSAAQKERIKMVWGFPIISEGDVSGVIQIFSRQSLQQDSRLVDTLINIGGQIGAFLSRKRMESAIRATQLTYEEIFNAANDAIFVHDIDTGEFLGANRKAGEMYGYEPEEISRMKVADLSAGVGYDQRRAMERIERAARGEPQLFEWLAKKKSGELFWVEVNLKRAVIAGKDRLLAAVRDITERKELQEELERRSQQIKLFEEKLRHAEKLMLMGMIASEMSHEVGTPLNIISGRVEMLSERESGNEKIRRDLDVINQQIERITKIIRERLDLTRSKITEMKNIDVNRLLRTILEFLRLQLEKTRITVELAIEPHLTVRGDEDQVQQLFLNLLINAIQAIDGPGKITIRSALLRRNGVQYLEIRVEDTGKGIPPGLRQKIFEPFFSTKTETGGTGLGLSVVRDIVTRHRGEILVESTEGHGSTFRILLPRSLENA